MGLVRLLGQLRSILNSMNYDRKIWKGLIKLYTEQPHCMAMGSSKETLASWYRKVNDYWVAPMILRDSLNKAVLVGAAIAYRNENNISCFELTRKKDKLKVGIKPFLVKSIYYLDLRCTNSLRNAGIETVGQLINYKSNLLKIPGIGPKSHEEIKMALDKKGLKIGYEVANLPWDYLNDFNWSYMW